MKLQRIQKSFAVVCMSVILCATALPLSAQKVSQEQAYVKAMAFFNRTGNAVSAQQKAQRKAPSPRLANSGDKIFIFNDMANGGYVIVSGDERMPEVLGYSDTGKIAPDHIPCNLKMILDDCARKVDELRANPHAGKIVSHQAAQQTAIAPLLGETAWDQNWPYNTMCPMIDGQHCLTGCTATATAQIMYYHKWPAKGQGSHSYEWNGQTLSVDFSQSTYQWDKMTPTYQWDSSKESINAVALLMRDVGYACNMNYGLSGSGAGGQDKALITYFDYDASMGYMSRYYCNEETWNSIILDELNHARPLFYEAGSEIGAHAMVIDGVDTNGYYHYNFGGGGDTNGYFSMQTLFFNKNPSINFSIKKNEGGTPIVFFCTPNDFVYEEKNGWLTCNEIHERSVFPVEGVTTALAIEDKKSHKVTYADEGYKNSFYAPSDLPDGNYMLYPVARYTGNDEWQKLLFTDNRQSFVDLEVKDGEYTYSNNHIVDFIQEGAVDVNGIVYFLDETSQTATVTFRNDRHDYYKGNITIPEKFTYQYKQYTVTQIGSDAFTNSDIGVLKIPKTVKSFAFSSFSGAKIGTILFEEGSQFKTVGGWAFNGAVFKSLGIDFPEGTEDLGNCGFQTCMLSRVSIPSSVTYLADGTFNYAFQFRTVMVHWPSPSNVTLSKYLDPFSGINLGLCWLFVPKATASKYKDASTWKDFGHILEMTDTVTANGLKYVLNDTDLSAYLLTQADQSKTQVSIPRSVIHQGKSYSVKGITPFAFANTTIKELTISSSVNYVGEGTFYCYQNQIEKIKFHSKTPPKVPDATDQGKEGFYDMMFDDYKYDVVTLYVPSGSKSKYKADSFWGQFTHIVEDPSLGEESIPGDADNDGFVNMIDVTVIIDYILNKNPSSFYFTNSDVNKDGLINMLDVTAIIEIILGK